MIWIIGVNGIMPRISDVWSIYKIKLKTSIKIEKKKFYKHNKNKLWVLIIRSMSLFGKKKAAKTSFK